MIKVVSRAIDEGLYFIKGYLVDFYFLFGDQVEDIFVMIEVYQVEYVLDPTIALQLNELHSFSPRDLDNLHHLALLVLPNDSHHLTIQL